MSSKNKIWWKYPVYTVCSNIAGTDCLHCQLNGPSGGSEKQIFL